MKGYRTLLVLAVAAIALIAWRFIAGLGATTGLSDGYPWGLWITYDVVTGTALACGGYAVAILVYILNKGQYHSLVRPAILTSALGYSIAGFSVIMDLGRFWNVYNIAGFWNWNFHSVLLEVALCIMAYVVVLWIELSPAFMERWKENPASFLGRLSTKLLPFLQKNLIWLIALGLLLPTMHQSSLGALMLIAVNKLHQLWHTSFLPALFLISCIGMGYGVVVLESVLSHRHFGRPIPRRMLSSLSLAMVPVSFLYLALRLIDLTARQKIGLAFAMDGYSLLFLFEMILFVAPALMLLSTKVRNDMGRLFQAAVLMIFAGSLYRFSVFWFAFTPGPGWAYVPAIPEILITIGLIAIEILVYVILVNQFPAIAGVHAPAKKDRAAAPTTKPRVAAIH